MFRAIHRYKGIVLPLGALLSLLMLIKVYFDHSQDSDISSQTSALKKPNFQEISTNYIRRVPQAIIIGARKGGTRALLKFLELNPNIRAASREVHFFDKPQNYKRGLEWYRSQMPLSSPNQITIEKSPAYFVTAGVPQKIKAMNSSIKLILILRNPVTRLISDYSQINANKNHAQELEDPHESIESDDEAEDPAVARTNETNSDHEKAQFEEYALRPDGGVDEQRPAVKTSMYSVHLERWKSYIPMRQIHLVDGENLVTNPYAELHQLELFLRLDPVIRPEDFVFNPQKGFYCIAKSSRHPNSTSNRVHRNRRTLNGSSQSVCLSKSKGRKHVAVSKSVIETLEQFYEPYNEYLFSISNRSFDWTSKNR